MWPQSSRPHLSQHVGHCGSAASLFDCWLQLHGLRIPPLPRDAWRTLAVMSESTAAPVSDCFGPGVSPATSRCAIRVLQLRFQAAVDAKQWDVARESVEKMLAVVVASKTAPSLVRDELVNFANDEARAGIAEEPSQILGFSRPSRTTPT